MLISSANHERYIFNRSLYHNTVCDSSKINISEMAYREGVARGRDGEREEGRMGEKENEREERDGGGKGRPDRAWIGPPWSSSII